MEMQAWLDCPIARATRGLRRPSLDARSLGQTKPRLQWRWREKNRMTSRRRAQTWRSLFFAPWTSQNAHDETVLVPCAQVKGSLAIPLMMRGKRNARSMTPLVGRTHAGNPPGRPLPRSSL